MIATLTRLTLQPGRRSEALDMLTSHEGDIAAENGVLVFEFLLSDDDDDVIYVHDVFTDGEARLAHTNASWHTGMRGRLATMLAAPPERVPVSPAAVLTEGTWH